MKKYDYIDNIYCKELSTDIKGFFSSDNIKRLSLEYFEGVVFDGAEYRPDKLAFYYLGDENLGWLISLANNFSNGIRDYWLGRKLMIPSKTSIMTLLKE